MMRTPVHVVLALLISAFMARAVPQATNPPSSTQELVAATLADLRGVEETIDRTGTGNPGDRRALWFSVVASPGGLGNTPHPRTMSSAAGTISVKRLRHQAPKTARQAYEKASRSKDPQKAANELERAIAIDPDYVEAHGDLGVSYTRLGRYPEATAEFRRAIALAPEESLSYSNLAWVLFEAGQNQEAEAVVRRALQLSPDREPAHLLLGRLLVESQEKAAEGLWHLEYAARTMPEARQLVQALRKK